jgi:hypothetical protein
MHIHHERRFFDKGRQVQIQLQQHALGVGERNAREALCPTQDWSGEDGQRDENLRG